jgi:glyoxylase-like metal-dependent hydrolase (beta-lactamase superfamily II)
MADTYRFTVGNYECIVLKDGCAPVDNPSDRLPNTATEDLERVMEERGIEEVVSCYNCLFVDTGDHKVLVDAGLGKTAHGGHLFEGLADNGIKLADIDTLIISHFHGDHINGLLDNYGNANFPNAQYVTWKTEWDYWTSQEKMNEMDEAGRDRMQARYEVMKQDLVLMTGEHEIVPGISAVALPGHTPGHMGLFVESDGERLLDVVDAIHYLPQLSNLNWAFKFDSDPIQAADSRRTILTHAANEELLTLMYHFPFPGLGHIHIENDEFWWSPIA